MRFLWCLVVAGAVATPAGAADWSQAQPVTLTATNYQFTPDRLTLKRATAYRLHIDNRGSEMHEFSAPELFKTSEIEDPGVLNADKTEVAVHPGEAKDLIFMPQQAGHYAFRCPDHDWAGMTGEITVE